MVDFYLEASPQEEDVRYLPSRIHLHVLFLSAGKLSWGFPVFSRLKHLGEHVCNIYIYKFIVHIHTLITLQKINLHLNILCNIKYIQQSAVTP